MVFDWLRGKEVKDGLLVENCHKTDEGGIVCDFETKEGSHFKVQSLDGTPQSLKAIRKKKGNQSIPRERVHQARNFLHQIIKKGKMEIEE